MSDGPEKRSVSHLFKSLLSGLSCIFYEKGLRLHLLLFWLLLLAQLLFVRSHLHSPLFFVVSLLASEPVLFGMVAVATRTALFLLPLILGAFLEFLAFLLAVVYFFCEIEDPNLAEWLQVLEGREAQVLNVGICISAAFYFLMLTVTSFNVFLLYSKEARKNSEFSEMQKGSSATLSIV